MSLAHPLRAAAIVLLSAMATTGCSGTEVTDESIGGNAGDTGGTGTSGASGGAGGRGAGGTAGAPDYDDYYDDCATGFSKLSCITTCGVDNDLSPGPIVTEQSLECSVMGIPFDFGVAFSVTDSAEDGFDGNRLVSEFILPAAFVDLLRALDCSFDVAQAELAVGTEGGETVAMTSVTPVPCLVCFFSGTPVTIRFDPVPIAVGVDEPLTLTALTLATNVGGLELVFSTEPPMDTCIVRLDDPP